VALQRGLRNPRHAERLHAGLHNCQLRHQLTWLSDRFGRSFNIQATISYCEQLLSDIEYAQVALDPPHPYRATPEAAITHVFDRR
jgi:hypothetical protein